MSGRALCWRTSTACKPSDVTWVRGGYEQAGRVEKITLNLPPDVRVEDAPDGATISGMLAERRDRRGDRPARAVVLRAGIRRSAGCSPIRGRRGRDGSQATGIFPIMHILGIRRTLAEQHPWLPAAA